MNRSPLVLGNPYYKFPNKRKGRKNSWGRTILLNVIIVWCGITVGGFIKYERKK